MITFETLSGTGTPHYATLQTLKFFMCSTIQTPESFFSAFSSITHLYLISTAGSILEPSYQVDHIRWPNLRDVTISPEVSPHVILLRISKGHPITTVYVPRDSLPPDEISNIQEKIEVVEVEDTDSLEYPGGLDPDVDEEEEEYGGGHRDYDSDNRSRRAFYEQNYGVDYDDSDDSELLEYWAVCGSD